MYHSGKITDISQQRHRCPMKCILTFCLKVLSDRLLPCSAGWWLTVPYCRPTNKTPLGLSLLP